MDHEKCRVISWEISKKQINTLLEAIIHADFVNTVSPSYAKEILTEEFGCGLEDILGGEARKITGIINGIDYEEMKPYYDTTNFIERKQANKAYLQQKTGLEVTPQKPLIGFIGRFSFRQKGIDIIHKMLTRIDIEKYQFIFLGKGDENWEQRFLWFMKFFPKNVFCSFEFNNELAGQIYSSSDFLLIPSRFEPCGLIQMIAMRHGTLPIARATGGLKDTIEDGVDGYLFKNYSSIALEKRLDFACDIWKNRRSVHNKMVEAAMKKDFSWDKSANAYIKLYEKVMGFDKV
jgi:starch synthase